MLLAVWVSVLHSPFSPFFSWHALHVSSFDSLRPFQELLILGMNIALTSTRTWKTSSATPDVLVLPL